MVLSKEIKEKIINILDSEEFKVTLYDGLDQEKRIELGQFYTPAKVCIQMLEKSTLDTFNGKTFLDPCVGSGNLLIACLIAGADSNKIYGNEYDAIAVDLCKKRINRACDILGKPHIQDWQIHQGNALIPDCLTEFGPEYDNTILKELLKKRWGLTGGWMNNPDYYKKPEQMTLIDTTEPGDLFGDYWYERKWS